MATITLDYDARNVQAKKALEQILSLGFFKMHMSAKKKTGLERALDDVEKGRVFFLAGPSKQKYEREKA